MIEEDYSFLCPYCGTPLSARLDPSAGKHQKFIQDCEICCRPIQIEARFEGGELSFFSADAEP
ncbi:MAG TPA: CPXCG motif-containing cysteine-rich protein [bacterium]|nr:CPXCG motif-containing cysteine-rich protein [bacterium]